MFPRSERARFVCVCVWVGVCARARGGGRGMLEKKGKVTSDMKVRVHNTLLVSFTNRTSECNEQRVFARDTLLRAVGNHFHRLFKV